MKRSVLLILPVIVLAAACSPKQVSKNEIDRKALVERHNPHVTALDSLSALSVGNGSFTFTADITGLQSFTDLYSGGIPLNTEADWGWHSFSNVLNLKQEQTRGEDGYPAEGKVDATQRAALEYFTLNEHRINLGCIGFEDFTADAVSEPEQTLDMYTGLLTSNFKYNGKPVKVLTSCDPELDMIAVSISSEDKLPVMLSLPYTNLNLNGDPSYWDSVRGHDSELRSNGSCAVIRVKMNIVRYYVKLNLENAYFRQPAKNRYEIVPTATDWGFTAEFSREYKEPVDEPLVASSRSATETYWKNWWEQVGAVDFTGSTDPRAAELERRVVLSQYLTGIQASGLVPPQNTGLTGRSSFGKIEANTVWWSTAHFALWGHPEMLKSTLTWYKKSYDNATATAKARGYRGACWPWLAGAEGVEAPFNVNAHMVSQQPNVIYLVKLLERAGVDVSEYEDILKATGDFMVEYAKYDEASKTYNISAIPMQGKQSKLALNPSFETAYWYYGFRLMEDKGWRLRQIAVTKGNLASIDGIYTSAEKDGNTSTEGHPAVLGALGMLPGSELVDTTVMRETLNWMLDNWSWDTASGQDFSMAAMTATRLGEPEKAIEALFMDEPTNSFLPNGQNPQGYKLTTNIPGNGALLSAVALMCAGWDGCETENPGFPKDGTWKVKWEGISPLP